jgi:nucleoporin NDC1
MRLVTQRENELPRLNEKLIYFCFTGTQVAILSALVHTGVDGDRLRMPATSVGRRFIIFWITSSDIQMPLTKRMKHMLPSVVFNTVYMTAFNCTLAPISYLFLRRTIYFTTLRIAYLFVRLSPSKAMPLYPFSIGLLYHSCKASLLCCVLWQTAQATFNLYLSQTPIIQGGTISQRSSDPNTSLLSGLRTSEKALTQAMAYQELVFIAFSVPSRRQAIFEDLDKRTWINIMREYLSQIDEVAQNNKSRPTETSGTEIQAQTASKQLSSTSMTLKSDNIFPPPQQTLIHRLSTAETSIGKSKGQKNIPSLFDRIKELYRAKVVPYLSCFELSLVSHAVKKDIKLDSQTRIPNTFILECAISALCQLVVASREEDTLGVVQRDIAKILEQNFICLDVLEDNLKKNYLPITKDESSLQHTNHQICINILRHGSQRIVDTFSENLKDLNMSANALAKAQEFSKDIWESGPPVGDSWVLI